jgi:ubiquinone/menaquinone biosynthesis C-methylase UbiE
MPRKEATRIVQINILAMQFVVTAPIIIQSLVENFNNSKLLFALGFIFTSLNFFHGKIAALDDEGFHKIIILYPKKELADFLLSTISVLLFIFISIVFSLDKFLLFIIINLFLRLNDSLLILLGRSISFDNTIRKSQLVWLFINISFLIIFSFIILFFRPFSSYLHLISILFFTFSILDIILDYSLNRKLYFEEKRTWQDLSGFWDTLQGEYGDIYRRNVINPKLKLLFKSVANKTVLDLGCGNGCISRFFNKEGANVIGIDKFDSMLTIAKRYTKQNIIYKKYDLDITNSAIGNGNFDIIIASFSFQDCNNIKNPFKTIKNNLSKEGKAIIIYENQNSFENEKESSELTKRIWLESSKKNGIGRKQLILWEARAILVGQGIEEYNVFKSSREQQEFSTVTHYWSKESYIKEGNNNDLLVLKSGDFDNVFTNLKNQTLKKYIEKPKFSYIIFTKKHNNYEF